MKAAEARQGLRSARNRVEWMEGKNSRHADEVAKASRSGYPKLITNQQAHIWTGGGATVIYRTRCSADGHACDHDPTEAPYSGAELDAATIDIEKDEQKLTAAEKALAQATASFDVAAGSRYAWWPLEIYVDPRKRRYQGQPISQAELDTLGPHELQRLITAGAVIELSP